MKAEDQPVENSSHYGGGTSHWWKGTLSFMLFSNKSYNLVKLVAYIGRAKSLGLEGFDATTEWENVTAVKHDCLKQDFVVLRLLLIEW